MMDIQEQIKNGLKKRHRSEKIFKNMGIFSIILSMTFLVILFVSIISKGYSSFFTHKIAFDISLKQEYFNGDISHRSIIKEILIANFPSVEDSSSNKRKLNKLLSKSSRHEIKYFLQDNIDKEIKDTKIWFTASSKVDIFLKQFVHKKEYDIYDTNLTKQQVDWINDLIKEDKIKKEFNFNFFKNADSREPEKAGVGASIVGSFFTVIVFLICAFPIGVMAGFYLEEFAPKNIITDIIEVTINNLAAIPSILYGLLGLILYLNFFHLPRSSSLVGGLTLSLLVLPIIIIATRNAINTIPSYIRDAAIALGASRVQVIFHHIFPLSLPGIMTGTILAISRALGETAPLLMIGMVAFVADVAHNLMDPTSVLPVQVYLWSDSPEPGFVEKTAGAIMVLLTLLIIFNGFAVYLRKKFEKKW